MLDSNWDFTMLDEAKDKKDDKKKVKGFKEFDPNKYIDTKPVLDEAVKNTAVITFGRMNPVTIGHEKLVAKVASEAAKRKADAHVFLSHSQDKKKNPLSYDDKIKHAQKAFGAIVRKSNAKTIIQIAQQLQSKYKDLVLVVGSDRVKEFDTLLNRYNGKDYNFDSISVVSAGDRDPDSEDVSGMSASKMRAAVASGDFSAFKKGLPKKLQPSADDIFHSVQIGMGMSEELELEERVISRQERRKRSIAARRNRFKLRRGKIKSERKAATIAVLRKRARKMAIKLLKDKFAKGKYNDLPAGGKEIVDKRLAKFNPKRIDALARKLLKKEKEIDIARRKMKKESIEEACQTDVKGRKKPHMLLNKEGKVKFDGRFKLYKKKVNESAEDLNEEILDLMEATEQFNEGEKKGLWDNIHAKRKRIKAGSGEKMRKPGSKGAPTDADFKAASESVELDEAKWKVSIPGVPRVYVDAQSASDVKRDMRKLVKPEHLDDIEIERVQPSEIKKDFRDRAAAKVNEEHGAGDWGTDELTNNFKAATPGENGKVTNVKKPSENKALKEGMGKKLAAQAALRIAAHYAKKTINNRLKNKDQQSQPEQ